MNLRFANLKRTSHRAGMTSVEFIGTLAALSCGIVLGSLYMGIDPQTLVHGVLEQVEPTKAAAPQDADAKSGATDTVEESHDGESLDEVTEPRHPTSLPSDANGRSESPSHTDHPTELGIPLAEVTADHVAVSPEATKSYWQVLRQSMVDETSARTGGITDPEQWQLLDYLKQRRKGHQLALDTLSSLDTHRVDARLLHHGRQVIAWHTTGVSLYERARRLLTDGPTADLTGPFAQSWQSYATQHRMEEKLVHNKHAAIANYLDHAYPDQAPFDPAY